jgi:tetrahydromethanopterin S-methyltransferase subunit E
MNGKLMTWFAVIGFVAMVAGAAEAWLESQYKSQSSIDGTALLAITNGTSRSTIESIMVSCPAATGTWSVLVINNSVTNLLKSTTLTSASYTLLYESGHVPFGADGVIYATGNNSSLTNTVKMAVHLKQ